MGRTGDEVGSSGAWSIPLWPHGEQTLVSQWEASEVFKQRVTDTPSAGGDMEGNKVY